MRMNDPHAHGVHGVPLISRIINGLIINYISAAADTARAASGDANDLERGRQAGIDAMQHLHLAGVDHRLTPKIADELGRAGLLREAAACPCR